MMGSEKGLTARLFLGEIKLKKSHAFGQIHGLIEGSRAHACAAFAQEFDQRRPDHPGTARYQNLFAGIERILHEAAIRPG
jgi:hypothetical protein